MSDILLSAFQLRHPPFGKDVATGDLWLDDARKDGIQRMIGAVSSRGHVLVKGEPGTGKNCVVRALRDGLSPVHFRVAYISNVTLGRRDFYRQLAHAMGVETKGTPAGLFEAIQRHIGDLVRDQRVQPVIVLDEAHLMPDSTLGHLHVLLNFDWDSQPFLSLVLVGLPELHARLKLGIHRSLLTRIATCVEIPTASADQTVAYIRKRLADAGAKSELFAPDALVLLHEISGGLLRSIDVLAETSLRVAAQRDIRLVDRDVVRRAFQLTPLA